MSGKRINPIEDTLLDRMGSLYKKEDLRITLEYYHENDLYLTLIYLAKQLRAPILPLKELPEESSLDSYLEKLCDLIGLRARNLILSHENEGDLSGTLVFERETNKPYVLEATAFGKTYAYDATMDMRKPFSPDTFLPTAFYIYRPFHEEKINFRHIYKNLIGYNKKDILIFLGFMVAGTVLSLFIPVSMGLVLDWVIPYADLSLLAQVVLGLLALAGLVYLGSLGQSNLFIRLKGRGTLFTLSGLWGRIFLLPMSFFRRFTVGDISLRARGIDQVYQELTLSLLSFISGIFFTIIGTIIIGFFSLSFALLLFCIGLLYGLVLLLTSLKQIQFSRTMMEYQARVQSLLYQLVSTILKIKVARNEQTFHHEWSKKFTLKMREYMKAKRFAILFQVLMALLSVLSTILIFMFMITAEKLSFGTIVMLLNLSAQLLGTIGSWMTTLSELIRVKPYFERLKPVLEEAPEEMGKISLPKMMGDIQFHGVSFSYLEDEPPVLSDINLHIKSGEFVALVGASGSGKTTLLKVILGLERPQYGSILVDNLSLDRLDLKNFRRQMGVVLQTPAFLTGNILENLSLSEPNVSLEEIWKALADVGMEGDIKALPMGLFTLLSEVGKSFSSGQMQRLMIARALVRRPSLLLFDEPTSALDNVNQAKVIETLQGLKMTKVMSAHRFSTIRHADKIVLLEGGRILETGTFKELQLRSEQFNDLLKRQKA